MPLIHDMGDCVEDCSLPITVFRRKPGSLVCGRAQQVDAEEICATASITPLSGDKLVNLPEGRRQEESVLIITTFCLHTVSTSDCDTADIIEYYGAHYQIIQVKDWSHMGGFYECIGTRCHR